MNTGFSVIENKIHQFIKKYYLNKLVKGLIFFISLTLVFSFALIITEYVSYLSPSRKLILIILFSVLSFSSFIYFIGIPLIGYIGIYRNISKRKINDIVSNHFIDLKDKFWNLLELKQNQNFDGYSQELLLASIDQKIEMLNPYDFREAISFKDNLKFAYFLLVLFFISAFITVIFPEVVKTSTQRLSDYNTVYVKPSPFSYQILNESLASGKGEKFTLEVEVIAVKEFDNVYIHFGSNTFMMKNDGDNRYSYSFPTLNNDINFQFFIDGYYSEMFKIEVLPKPFINFFSIEVDKPAYTGLKNEVFNNVTEVNVPIGSKGKIIFNAPETSKIILETSDTLNTITESFIHEAYFNISDNYRISLANEHFTLNDYLKIEVRIISDEYPGIFVEQVIDETDFSRIYFRGLIEDDYGFTNLRFVTMMNEQIDSVFKIEIYPNLLSQNFLYAYDFSTYRNSSSNIKYYFEILDNDRINGPKSTKSQLFSFSFPDTEKIFDYQDENQREIESIISESMNLTRDIQMDMQDLQQKMINSELNSWERNEIIKNITSKKQQLEDALKSISQRNEELSKYLQSFTEQDREIVEKQMQIQEILEDVMSEELKQLMEEFNRLMEEFDENKMNNIKDRMDISLDDLQQQLDRNLEMLKRMKMEQQLEQIQSQIDKHIEEQERVENELDSNTKPEDLIDKQKQEKEALQKLKETYQNLEQFNEELQNPVDLFDFNDEFDQIDQEFNESIEQKQNNNKEKSKESIQRNQQNMQNLSSMMEQMMEAAFAEQNFENLADLLQILDNVVTFSFNQEDLLVIPSNSDFDSQILAEQKKLYQDFQIIKDSIYALALRHPSVNMTVNKEIVSIENNFRIIDQQLSESRVNQAKINQQLVFTSANNIALFLSEVIKQLQEQMANSMPGNQNCQNPGNSSQPSEMGESMKSMQQSLQDQLEKMMQMMKEGADGSQIDSEMGQALSRQEKLQEMLQRALNQGNIGSDAQETLKQADELLSQVRQDILRNNLNERTINRNQEILTRLLQAENAENERDLDERRQAETAKEQLISESIKYFENPNSNDKFEERLIRQKLILNRFYQQRYQNYINQLDSINGSNY